MTLRSSHFYAEDRRAFVWSLLLFSVALSLCVYIYSDARRNLKFLKVYRVAATVATICAGLRLAYIGFIFLIPGEVDEKDEALAGEIDDLGREIYGLGQRKLGPKK